jgi:hypothetical protein
MSTSLDLLGWGSGLYSALKSHVGGARIFPPPKWCINLSTYGGASAGASISASARASDSISIVTSSSTSTRVEH